MAQQADHIAGKRAAAPVEQAASPLRLEVLSDQAAISAIRDQLETLCEDLSEPNVFYEPWMLFPALRQLGGGQEFRFLCLYETAGGGRLCGFFPLVLVRTPLHRRLPLPGYGLWEHRQCFRCTPLMREGLAERCWEAVLAWLAERPAASRLLHVPRLPADGAAGRALRQVMQRSPALRHVVLQHDSAFLRAATSGDEALHRAMSGRSLSGLRRKLRRLRESGELAIKELAGEPDVSGAIEAFLELEASGWKGAAGTALAASAAESAFFRTVMREAHRRGRLSLLCLRHNGRMIAARSLLLAAPGSFVFKIAFDETLSKYSPGVLLEMEAVRRLHDASDPLHAAIAWSDSCAAPDNGPFYRCWPERETIADYRITSGWGPHAAALALFPLLRGAVQSLRGRSGPGA